MVLVVLLVEVLNFGHNSFELVHALLGLMLADGGRVTARVESVSLVLLGLGSANSAPEEVFVFLLREVDVVVTMGVRVGGRVPSIVLP